MPRCKRIMGWIGQCPNITPNEFCEKHAKDTCFCGERATRDCESTMGAFVCGIPTCAEHACPAHTVEGKEERIRLREGDEAVQSYREERDAARKEAVALFREAIHYEKLVAEKRAEGMMLCSQHQFWVNPYEPGDIR